MQKKEPLNNKYIVHLGEPTKHVVENSPAPMSTSNHGMSSSPERTHNRVSPTTRDTGGTKAPATEQVKTVMGPCMGMPPYLTAQQSTSATLPRLTKALGGLNGGPKALVTPNTTEQVNMVLGPYMGLPTDRTGQDAMPERLVGFDGMLGDLNLQSWPGLSLGNWTFEGAPMSMSGGSGVALNSVDQFGPFPITNAGVQGQAWRSLTDLMNPVFGGGTADLANINEELMNTTNSEIPNVDAYRGAEGMNGGMANGYGMMSMNSVDPSISQSFELSSIQTSTNHKAPPIDDLNSNGEISLGTRVRKPATSKEVVPLPGMKKTQGDLPTWIALALDYLNEGIAVKAWSECLEAWTTFERENRLSEVSSVSSRRDVHI